MGRPYKGLRMQVTARVAADDYSEMARLSESEHVTISEWVAEAVRLRVKREKRNQARRGVADDEQEAV